MGPPLPPEIDSDSTKQRRIGEYVHLVEVDEHGRVTVPFQRDVIVRPGCGIRRLRGWQQYVSCRSGTPRAAERWPSRQDQPRGEEEPTSAHVHFIWTPGAATSARLVLDAPPASVLVTS